MSPTKAWITQPGSIAVPVEGTAALSLIQLIEPAEVLVLYSTKAFNTKESEIDLVFGVRLVEEIFEIDSVLHGNTALARAVCNLEEEAILVALDLVVVFRADGVDSEVLERVREARIMFERILAYSWETITFLSERDEPSQIC